MRSFESLRGNALCCRGKAGDSGSEEEEEAPLKLDVKVTTAPEVCY